MAIKIPVDFKGVEARSGGVRVPEGDYLAKVVKVEKKAAQSGNPMLVVTFEGLNGELQGKRIMDRHVLIQNSLWTLRNMLEAMGFKVKPAKMNLTDSMLMGKKVGLTIVDGEEYQGRIRSEVADYVPTSVVGNKTTADEAEDLLDNEEDEDELEDEEEVDEEEVEEFEEEEDDFDFDDEDEEDDKEEPELSFGLDEIFEAKGPQLKEYLKEAMEAGWEFELGDKPKVAEVREALQTLFEDEEDDEEEDLEGFDLDDLD